MRDEGFSVHLWPLPQRLLLPLEDSLKVSGVASWSKHLIFLSAVSMGSEKGKRICCHLNVKFSVKSRPLLQQSRKTNS